MSEDNLERELKVYGGLTQMKAIYNAYVDLYYDLNLVKRFLLLSVRSIKKFLITPW